jgi:hypothetical protein
MQGENLIIKPMAKFTPPRAPHPESLAEICNADAYAGLITACLDANQAEQLSPHHLANFLALSAELYLSNHDSIAAAFERNNGLEVTFKLSISPEKDAVEMSFKPVDTYKQKATADVPDDDQHEFDFKNR